MGSVALKLRTGRTISGTYIRRKMNIKRRTCRPSSVVVVHGQAESQVTRGGEGGTEGGGGNNNNR